MNFFHRLLVFAVFCLFMLNVQIMAQSDRETDLYADGGGGVYSDERWQNEDWYRLYADERETYTKSSSANKKSAAGKAASSTDKVNKPLESKNPSKTTQSQPSKALSSQNKRVASNLIEHSGEKSETRDANTGNSSYNDDFSESESSYFDGTVSVTDNPGNDEEASFGESFFADESGDYGDLFADAKDSEVSKEEEAQQQGPVLDSGTNSGTTSKKIEFYGKFNTSMGMLTKIYPEATFNPFASFENYLGFTAKPFSDITIRGQFYTNFPDFNFEIDTLYFDYIMNDILYVTAGATGTSWGNSMIFDTNILDDKSDDTTQVYSNEHVSTKRFDAILTVPVGRGQVQALGMYQGKADTDLGAEYLSYAGAIEYPVGPIAIKLFARKWADKDERKMDPAVGAEITADLFGNHITLWGKVHSPVNEIKKIMFARFVAGISRLIRTDKYGDFGFAVEYQFTYDYKRAKDKRKTQDIAFTVGWHDAFDTDFTPAVRWYMNLDDRSGYVIPSLSYDGFSHMNVTLIVPVIYGGASYTYKTEYKSEKGTPTVLIGLIFTLSVSY